jgi:hypothetical protein
MVSVRRKNWCYDTQSDARELFPGAWLPLLPAILSPAIQKFSLCVGEDSDTALLESCTEPTSIFIYPKSTNMNKQVLWICHQGIFIFYHTIKFLC